MGFYWHLSDFLFSWSHSRLGFWGERPQRENVLLIALYQAYLLSTRLITVDVDLDNLAKVVFVRALHHKFTLLFHFFNSPLWKEVTPHNPHLKSEELCSTSFRAEYIQTLFGILLTGSFVSSPPPQLSIYVMYLGMYGMYLCQYTLWIFSLYFEF